MNCVSSFAFLTRGPLFCALENFILTLMIRTSASDSAFLDQNLSEDGKQRGREWNHADDVLRGCVE